MTPKHFLFHGISSLCSMAAEGEQPAGGGGVDTSNVTATEVGGTQRLTVGDTGEADAKRTADSTSTGAKPGEGEAPARPEGLPEGFDTVEAFVAAVNDGTYKPGEAAKEPTEAPAPNEAIQAAFADERIAPFATQFQTQGDLTAEQRSEAAKALNVPQGLVDAYVDALKTNATAATTIAAAPFHEAAGGAEAYQEFQNWTRQEGNMSPAIETAANALINQGKTAEALIVLKPAIEAWKAAGNGGAPRDVTNTSQGDGGGAAGGEAYASWEEVRVDMANPQYQRDPAFREKVTQKLSRSNFA